MYFICGAVTGSVAYTLTTHVLGDSHQLRTIGVEVHLVTRVGAQGLGQAVFGTLLARPTDFVRVLCYTVEVATGNNILNRIRYCIRFIIIR